MKPNLFITLLMSLAATQTQAEDMAVTDGFDIQKTTYYPYGEPTVEPKGQRYLFGGKEREHAGGRNSYDFGARNLTPYGVWSSPDPMATKFYNLNPYSYCAGDPINNIDYEGKLVIFINGMHDGTEGGSPTYWGNLDDIVMGIFGDYRAQYFDGSYGGMLSLYNLTPFHNIYSANRNRLGYFTGYNNASYILGLLENDETIKVVTHSMGGIFGKGFIKGIQQ